MSWRTVKLQDICEIQPPKKEAKDILSDDSEVSFMGMNLLGVDKVYAKPNEVKVLSAVYKAYTYFAENDVLLAKITPCFENGKLGIAQGLKNGIGFGSSEFIVFRCKEVLLPKYLYYFLNQKSFRESGKKNMSGAVGHKRVKKEFIENTLLFLPPILEQRRIVAKLDVAFAEIDKIAEIEKINIKNIKKFYSEFISEELNKLSDTDSKKLSDISELTRGPFGGSITKAMFVQDGYAVYEQKHAIRNNFENIKYFINEEKFNELKRFELRSGDLLMSCSGTMGKIALVPKNIKRGI